MSQQVWDAQPYVQATSELLQLTIPPAAEMGVRANLVRMSAIASLVMEFPLEDECEPAPVFQP
jgi:hypothetical protein